MMVKVPPSARPTAPRRNTDPRRKGPLTAERILDAAESCFAQRGFAGTSLREVADEVGIRIPSLYNHFPNKAALYEAVLERGMTPIVEVLTRFTGDEAGAVPQPGQVLQGMMEVLQRRPNLPRLIQYELLAGGEHLTPMLQNWLGPVIERGLRLMNDSPAASHWKPEELPLLLVVFYNVVIGHFTTGPLFESLHGQSPLDPKAIDQQTRFLSQLVNTVIGADAPLDPTETDTESAEE